MGTDPDSVACNGSFLKCTSYMCIQFQQPLFIDQNAKAGRGTEKIEMKIRHAFQEFHFQLNIIYSYFVDESSQPSHVIKDKI